MAARAQVHPGMANEKDADTIIVDAFADKEMKNRVAQI